MTNDKTTKKESLLEKFERLERELEKGKKEPAKLKLINGGKTK